MPEQHSCWSLYLLEAGAEAQWCLSQSVCSKHYWLTPLREYIASNLFDTVSVVQVGMQSLLTWIQDRAGTTRCARRAT